jgi:hypothetical protein
MELPGQQLELINRVASVAKKPVVLVLLSGGPVDISSANNDKNIGSILWAGYPSQAGGSAMAGKHSVLLFGFTCIDVPRDKRR